MPSYLSGARRAFFGLLSLSLIPSGQIIPNTPPQSDTSLSQKVHADLLQQVPIKVAEQTAAPTPNTPNLNGAVAIGLADNLISDAQKQLAEIQIALSGLSAMINRQQVGTLKNKKDTLQNIATLCRTIDFVQRERFVEANNILAAVLLQRVSSQIMQHLIKHLSGTFTELPPFTPSGPDKRTLETMTAEKIKLMQAENRILLKKVNGLVDGAGLRAYNRVYRTLNKWCIEPCSKWRIPQRIALGATCLLGGGLVWSRLCPKSFKRKIGLADKDDTDIENPNSVARLLRGFYGQEPQRGMQHVYHDEKSEKYVSAQTACELSGITKNGFKHWEQEGWINDNQLGFVGNIEKLYKQSFVATATACGVTAFFLSKLKSEWDSNVYPCLAKYATIAHNFLMGGACLKEARKRSGAIEEITFDDLVGLGHVKEYFKLLVDYLENPEPHDRAGITPSKGILLVGDTRTGKSHSVKALFTEIKKMLKKSGKKDAFKLKEFDIGTIQLNGFDRVIRFMQKEAPCIIFIDEVDLLTLQRRGDQRLLSEFLSCMSGALNASDPTKQVIIIAATNKVENIDSALRQPGRFGKEIRFEYPPLVDRITFLTNKLKKLSLDPDKFEIDRMARETDGLSYEALNTLVDNALLQARLRGKMLSQSDLDGALDSEIRHIINPADRRVDEAEKHILSVHFAGRALALAKMAAFRVQMAKVTIRPVMAKIHEQLIGGELYEKDKFEQQKRFNHGAVFTNHEQDTLEILTRDDKLRLCQFYLAGEVAEEVIFGSCGHSCATEAEAAHKLALSLVLRGMKYQDLPQNAKETAYREAQAVLEGCRASVRTLLEKDKTLLEKLARVLQKRETMNAKEVHAVLNGKEGNEDKA